MKNTISSSNSKEKTPSKLKTIRQIIAVLVSWWMIATNSIFIKDLNKLKNYKKPEKIELLKIAENEVKHQEYKTSQEILNLVTKDPNYNQTKALKLQLEVAKKRSSPSYQRKSFKQWLMWKSNGELISKIWEIVMELSPVWDAKDLYKQYKIYKTWKSVDRLIVWLSALWIITTISTITSLWSTASAKIFVSKVKELKKINKIPNWLKVEIFKTWEWILYQAKKLHINSFDDFKKYLKDLKKTNIKNYTHIEKFFSSFWEIYKNTKNFDTSMELISKTKKAEDLKTMVRLSKTFGKETSIFLKLWWDDFIKVYKKYGSKVSKKTYEKALKTKWGLKSLEKLGEKRFLKRFHKPHSRLIKEIEKVFWKISDYVKAQIIAFATLFGESVVFIWNLIWLLRRKKK